MEREVEAGVKAV